MSPKTMDRLLLPLLAFFVTFLFTFNLYYFFIRRGVGPEFYLQKLLKGDFDAIENQWIYQDLSEEYEHLNRLYPETRVTVFVGDSMTRNFNLGERSKNDLLLNRGIPSDTTQGLLKRLDQNINNLQINKIFILIGYNDLVPRSDDQIVENIQRILARITADQIYLQSLLPVSADRKETNQRIIQINHRLKKIALENGHRYIDLHAKFRGTALGINPRLTRDGVHPNDAGYQLWFALIKPYLDLKETPQR